MLRRDFLHHTSRAAAGALLTSSGVAKRLAAIPALPQKFAAADTVTLGRTGIQTSRLAMGTGTVGVGHHSHQTALGIDGLSRLLLNGHDNGLRFFDAADSYGSHPHVAEALKHLDRTKVTLLTKSWSRTAPEMRADHDRFRKELGTDHLDIVLMHCLTEGDWTTRYQAVIGMKILGQGTLRNRQDEALRFALGLGVLDAFTIGAESIAEQNDLMKRIAAA